MIRMNEQCEREGLRRIAELCVAARTAPKACGRDNIVTAIVEDEDERRALAERMMIIGEQAGAAFFTRDAKLVMEAPVVVIIGTRLDRLHIPACNFCGYEGCDEAERAGARCAYNAGDLGIALGSAAACAADHRADNRMMYTVGRAAVELELLGAQVKIAHGIPLSAQGKNVFFDRK